MYVGSGLALFILFLCAIVLCAWIVSIVSLVDASKVRSEELAAKTGTLYFIGFFASPIVLAPYILVVLSRDPEKASDSHESQALPQI